LRLKSNNHLRVNNRLDAGSPLSQDGYFER
jgi:hypothetical protein